VSKKNRIYFLAKDPHWAFIWWEIGEKIPRGQLTLRIHDVTHIIFDGKNSHRFFDIEVIGETDHWYPNLPVSNRNYCVDLGIKDERGNFYLITRSNTICLPRDCPSDSTDEHWGTIDI
jgi:hypothetical protein